MTTVLQPATRLAFIEWQVIENLRAQDVDVAHMTLVARGGKNRWRRRTVDVGHEIHTGSPSAELRAWCWKIVSDYVSGFIGDVLLFADVSEWAALKVHKAAAVRKRAEESTLHDWRHTFAIRELKDGKLPQWVKRQLGHSPHSTTLETVYGAFIPVPKSVPNPDRGNSATNPATPSRNDIKKEA